MENQGLDKFDESLLELLQRDAKQSMADVAAAVGLSEPACYRRIRRLRDLGVIEREVAIVRPRTMGWPLSMIVLVTLETDRSEVVDGLIRRMRPIGEVLDVWYVTGDQDLVLHVIARDMEYSTGLQGACFTRMRMFAVSRRWSSCGTTRSSRRSPRCLVAAARRDFFSSAI